MTAGLPLHIPRVQRASSIALDLALSRPRLDSSPSGGSYDIDFGEIL